MKILAINPGATSTKIALYQNKEQQFEQTIEYTSEQLQDFDGIFDQFDLRLKDILNILKDQKVESLDAVAARGGLIGPVPPGAIEVNDDLVYHLRHRPVLEHASNLGAALAQKVVQQFGSREAKAYIYDPVTVDSMLPVARITGIKGIERQSIGHHLNMRAVARNIAHDLDKSYEEINAVVVHMGGGASASAHQKGEVVDFISDDEIMFSAERSGGLPVKVVIQKVEEMGAKEFSILSRKNAGLQSHCHTKDLRQVLKQIQQGDDCASLVFDALALGISKTIAALSTTLEGKVDMIGVTGGMAYSKELIERVAQRSEFIAPVKAYPGEQEMDALAFGILRVLNNEEEASQFVEK
ncbi:butyrate kinase [Dolosicoccus paucivorans]|uniref:Probable butyrate kinase n=1 Tax=Dolosicoccus paucivorans TaxID=84521 RepID=A0A2N6SLJ2_9LACT|nr:butyrate kinase [Dolosicoccus paucivorans]PMB83803.1 butyrate kinase [Dolosicoccus paucivorans]PMC57932.1 butyrate kinase [Dolosicoccus paucivorans]